MSRPSEKMSAFEREKRLATSDMMTLLGVKSRHTIWRRVKKGELPKPIYAKPHQPRWKFGEVMDWLEGYEEPFDAEPRGFKGDEEKLDEFVPKKKPLSKAKEQTEEKAKEPEKAKKGTIGERLREKYGINWGKND